MSTRKARSNEEQSALVPVKAAEKPAPVGRLLTPIEALVQAECEARAAREAYLKVLSEAQGATNAEVWMLNDTGTGRDPSAYRLAGVAEAWLEVQKAKLTYDAALERVREAREVIERERAETSQKALERLQRSMTWATWVIAGFTLLAALGTFLGDCQH